MCRGELGEFEEEKKTSPKMEGRRAQALRSAALGLSTWDIVLILIHYAYR